MMTIRELLKTVAFGIATVLVLPELLSFRLRAALVGRDRALESSSQTLALVPGLIGHFLRRAFYFRTLRFCHPSVTIEAGTFFTKADSWIGQGVYIGPRCQLGLVTIEPDALLAGGVQVPSGPHSHEFADPATPIRDQPVQRKMVHIGAGCWVGSAAVVMADVGPNTVVGAGAVVTRALPGWSIAVGIPARVVRNRSADPFTDAS